MPVNQEEMIIIGSEGLHPNALNTVARYIGESEKPLVAAGFDWGHRVIIITPRRVVVADNQETLHLHNALESQNVTAVTKGRTLIIRATRKNEEKCSFKEQETTETMAYLINNPQEIKYETQPPRDVKKGFVRDAGAAATFGLSATTKHKRAEAKYEERRKRHEKFLASYGDTLTQIQSALDSMNGHRSAAWDVLFSMGAVTTNSQNNIIFGWYKPPEEVEGVKNDPERARSAIGAIPAFGLGIGVPAAVWTMVGVYGTAATGAAIGNLSGAAAGAATAAWIGRAATLGMGGMTAGRIAMGPIGLAASALTLPIGAAIAGSKERKYINQTEGVMRKMTILERVIEESVEKMKPLHSKMVTTTADIQRHTGQLEQADPNAHNLQEIAQRLDMDLRKAAKLENKFHAIVAEQETQLKANGLIDEE